MMPRPTVLAMLAALSLSACGGGEPDLMNFASSQEGPDEFLVAPAKPLEMPANPGALPPPAPGGTNRADPSPEADAVAVSVPERVAVAVAVDVALSLPLAASSPLQAATARTRAALAQSVRRRAGVGEGCFVCVILGRTIDAPMIRRTLGGRVAAA